MTTSPTNTPAPHATTSNTDPLAGAMSRRQGTYLNVAVSVLTGVLALNVLGSHESALLPEARAQASAAPVDGEDTISGRISAAEQRKQIIAELKSLNQKLDHIDGVVKGGLSVRVTDMPADKSAAKSEPKARPEGKPEPRIEVRSAPTSPNQK